VSRRYVWSRNLVNEEAKARAGLRNQREKNLSQIDFVRIKEWQANPKKYVHSYVKQDIDLVSVEYNKLFCS
jgi:hypothetical protein